MKSGINSAVAFKAFSNPNSVKKNSKQVSMTSAQVQKQEVAESFGDKFLKSAQQNKELFPLLSSTQAAGVLLTSKSDVGNKLNHVV